MPTFMTVQECFNVVTADNPLELDGIDLVHLQGWVRTNRSNNHIGFIELNDGTSFRNVQCVYDATLPTYTTAQSFNTGTAISVIGNLKVTPQNKQPFEIVCQSIHLEGSCDSSYPLQKKRHSFEYLREIAHLRVRSNTFSAVFRVRSLLTMAIHEFFQNQGFVNVHTPIITGNDAEGAGEIFKVESDSFAKKNDHFFGKEAALTVSGQLHAEAFALAFRDVYTFGPTFRAENSNTTRHASEFWMIEPEIAFADLDDNMNLIEDMVTYCVNYILVNAPNEMKFFNDMIDSTVLERLHKLLESEFVRMTYTQAIEHLLQANVTFDFPVVWGMDLQAEHERYICEVVVNGPVFLTDYPKEIKAFYMRLNDDNKTVAACDLLVPGVGELVGGSQREERLEYLEAAMTAFNIDKAGLEWYLDLRRFGGVKHAGFGLGFERFLMYITGMQNIRDVIPFARTPKNLNY